MLKSTKILFFLSSYWYWFALIHQISSQIMCKVGALNLWHNKFKQKMQNNTNISYNLSWPTTSD